jgi:hypothetical protein
MTRFIVVAAVLLLAGCGGEGSSGRSSDSAELSGVVMIGPTPGPCMANTPCSRPARHVELEFKRSGQSPVSVTTDEQGRYKVQLEPGTYRVRAVAYPLPATIQPTTVTVEDDARVNIEIDSGVR